MASPRFNNGRDTHVAVCICREELAWAAGFFDGEGSAFATNRKGKKPRLHIQVAQIDREVLDRFMRVVRCGNVTGPYKRKASNHRDRWQFSATSFEEPQAIVAMLFGFLGTVKRRQALAAIRRVHEARNNDLGWRRPKRKHGQLSLVRRDFESGSEPLSRIAKQHGITSATAFKWMRTESWKRPDAA